MYDNRINRAAGSICFELKWCQVLQNHISPKEQNESHTKEEVCTDYLEKRTSLYSIPENLFFRL